MILLNDDEIGHLVNEGLMTVHSYIAIGQMVAKAQLKKVVDKWGETPRLLIRDNVGGWGIELKAVNDFWQALLKEVE